MENNDEPTDLGATPKVCHLCYKESPIFFYKNDEQIDWLPDSVLTPILKKMKADLAKSKKRYTQGAYLAYMNCTSKFIKPCECSKEVHSYCMTAYIIQ